MKGSWIRLGVALIGYLSAIFLNADAIDETQYGVFQPGGYLIGFVESGSKIYFKDQKINTQLNGMYVIGFDRDERGAQEIRFVDSTGNSTIQSLDIGSRQYNIQRINGIEKTKVTPDKRNEQRIATEYKQVKLARSVQSGQSNWLQPFIWPVFGPVTGVYGSQRILNGVKKNPHFGVDVAKPRGTPVYAPNSGRVTLADDLYFSGNTVIIDHGLGVLSTLMHLDDFVVSVDDRVRQGEIIGHIGSTGRSTGPHLDWRINWNETRLDPSFWVPSMDSMCNLMSRNDGVGKKEVVILLHGLDPNASSMEQLGRSLLKDGYVICNQHYSSTQHSIEQQSGYLANAIAKAQQSGYDKIHVLTHGTGGIIARYYLQGRKLPGDGVVIMLSPPSNGNDVTDASGRYSWFDKIRGLAAIQLSTDSKILSNRLSPIRSKVGLITENQNTDPWFGFLFKGRVKSSVSMSSVDFTQTSSLDQTGRNTALTYDFDRVLEQVRHFLQNEAFAL